MASGTMPPKISNEQIDAILSELRQWVEAQGPDFKQRRGQGIRGKLRQLDSAAEAKYYFRLVNYEGRIQANAGLAEQLRGIEVLVGPHVEVSRKRLRSETTPREETAAEIATSSRGLKDAAADRPPAKRQCAPKGDPGCSSVTSPQDAAPRLRAAVFQ